MANLTDFGADIFLHRFDLTEQLRKFIFDIPKKTLIDNITVIQLGDSNERLNRELRVFGINEVINFATLPKDIESLLAITSRYPEKNFVVLTGDVELFDNFGLRLRNSLQLMLTKKKKISFLSGVSIKKNSKFEPSVLSKSTGTGKFQGMSSLNGLILIAGAKYDDFAESPVDPIVCFRIEKLKSQHFITSQAPPIELLLNAHMNSENLQTTVAIQREVNKNINADESFVLNAILTSKRLSRRRILFSLISVIPGIRPFNKLLRPLAIKLLLDDE